MAAKILIVEDEPAVLEMISFVLEQAGFETQQAANSEEARRQLSSSPPDMILMDWMLPGMSGIE